MKKIKVYALKREFVDKVHRRMLLDHRVNTRDNPVTLPADDITMKAIKEGRIAEVESNYVPDTKPVVDMEKLDASDYYSDEVNGYLCPNESCPQERNVKPYKSEKGITEHIQKCLA